MKKTIKNYLIKIAKSHTYPDGESDYFFYKVPKPIELTELKIKPSSR